MPIGQNEPIAISPFGIGRVVAHELVKEQVHQGGVAQRRPGVSALCLLDGIHGKKPQCVDRYLFQLAHKTSLFFTRILRFTLLRTRRSFSTMSPTRSRYHAFAGSSRTSKLRPSQRWSLRHWIVKITWPAFSGLGLHVGKVTCVPYGAALQPGARSASYRSSRRDRNCHRPASVAFCRQGCFPPAG